jgi:hypothetical protein
MADVHAESTIGKKASYRMHIQPNSLTTLKADRISEEYQQIIFHF